MADTDERAAAPHAPGHVGSHPSAKEYVRIGLILAVLTGLEVTASYLDVSGAILIPTLYVLSIIKFLLVVMWFMHLRFDSRLFRRLFVTGMAFALIVFFIVLATFFFRDAGAFTESKSGSGSSSSE